jgi:hypothetical protein
MTKTFVSKAEERRYKRAKALDLKPMSESENLLHACSICAHLYEGFGHNAEPVNSGRCCDDCNWAVVIPARIQSLYRSK